MKKFFSALVLMGLLVVPVVGLADIAAPETPDTTAPELIESAADLKTIIDNIGNWVFVILLSVAAIFLIVAGFFFITAGGNPEQVTKARQMLINALIGVAIALGAKGLVAVIGSILGYTT